MIITSTQYLGSLPVLIEFDYTPGEREEGPESRAAGPAVGASMVATRVNLCNSSGHGCMVGIEHINADDVALWEENALKEMSE